MTRLSKVVAVLTALIIVISSSSISWGALMPLEFSPWAEGGIKRSIGYDVMPKIYEDLDMREAATRKEFTYLAVNIYETLSGEKIKELSYEPFLDISDEEVGKAFSIGIVNGVGEDMFDPEASLTREQAATMLTRIYLKVSEKPVDNRGSSLFKDDKYISSYAKEAVYFMAKKGMVEGMGDNTFGPLLLVTKEQALTIGARMLDSWFLSMDRERPLKYTFGMRTNTLEEIYSVLEGTKETGRNKVSLRMDKGLYDHFISLGLPYYFRGIEGITCRYYEKIELVEMEVAYNRYLTLSAYINNKLEGEITSEILILDSTIDHILENITMDSMSLYQKERAVHDYMVKTYEYDTKVKENDGKNISRSFAGLLQNQKGVCSAYAELFDLFMMKIGVPSLTVIGTVKDGGGHMWNMVYLSDNWHMVDVTWDDPVPDRPGKTRYNYFNISTEQLKETHIFEEENYPLATSGKIN